MTQILIKVIRPKHMNIRAITEEIEKQADKEADMMRKELQKTTTTWSQPPPFLARVEQKGRDVYVYSRPDMRTNAGKIWMYLEKGTKTRWAVMSNPFAPKTSVGRLGSRRGSGKSVIRGREAMQRRSIPARPGIKAREWGKAAAKVRRRPFYSNMQRAINRGAKRIF